METARFRDTLPSSSQSTRRLNSKEYHHRRENLKSKTYSFFRSVNAAETAFS
jgi:hypothetical protein